MRLAFFILNWFWLIISAFVTENEKKQNTVGEKKKKNAVSAAAATQLPALHKSDLRAALNTWEALKKKKHFQLYICKN